MNHNKFTYILLSLLIIPFFLIFTRCQQESLECPNCPTLNTIFPDKGKGDTIVTIIGSNFSGDTSVMKVFFNKVAAEIISSSETHIVVKAPLNGTTGPVAITRLAKDTRGTELLESSNNLEFTYIGTLTSFTPLWGTSGTEVRISGVSFGKSALGNEIVFGNKTNFPKSAAIKSWSDTVIVVTVPQGSKTGPITLKFGNTSLATDKEFVYEYTGTLSDYAGNGTNTISDNANLLAAGMGGLKDVKYDEFNKQLVVLCRRSIDSTILRRITSINQLNTFINHPYMKFNLNGITFFGGPVDYNNNLLSIDPSNGNIFFTASTKTSTMPLCIRYYNFNNTYYSGGVNNGLFYTYNTIGSDNISGSNTSNSGNVLFSNIKSLVPGIDKNNSNVIYVLDNGKINKIFSNNKDVDNFIDSTTLKSKGVFIMSSICADNDGNVFISSSSTIGGGKSLLHRSNKEGDEIIKIAGDGYAIPKDGEALTDARLCNAQNLTFDGGYNIYFTEQNLNVASQGACTIRKYNIKTGIISLVAGTYGNSSATTFSSNIVGLAFDKAKNILYIADAGYNKIKKIEFK
jgi:hypothetical protein